MKDYDRFLLGKDFESVFRITVQHHHEWTQNFRPIQKRATKTENRSFKISQNKINESFRRAISWGNIRPMMRRKSISLDNIRSFFTILAREVDCVAKIKALSRQFCR